MYTRLNFFFLKRKPFLLFAYRFDEQKLTKDIFRTNNNYGSLDIEVSRVVFVHGSIDPWHALGKTHSSNSRAPAIFIRGSVLYSFSLFNLKFNLLLKSPILLDGFIIF